LGTRAHRDDATKFYLLRGGAAKVLATSNAGVWRGVGAPVEIPRWPREIGADCLIVRCGVQDRRPLVSWLTSIGMPAESRRLVAAHGRNLLPVRGLLTRRRYSIRHRNRAPTNHREGRGPDRAGDAVAPSTRHPRRGACVACGAKVLARSAVPP
jgi:hypothetical protein